MEKLNFSKIKNTEKLQKLKLTPIKKFQKQIPVSEKKEVNLNTNINYGLVKNKNLNNLPDISGVPINFDERVSYIRNIFQNQSLVNYYKKTIPKDKTTYHEIAKYYKNYSDNQIEQIALIYIWICENIKYDMISYNNHTSTYYDPKDVFKYGLSVCEGFARLFKAFCDEIGIKCEKITGYAKGLSYKEGQEIIGTNHAWNTVYIGNRWFLIDSTWGKGSLEFKSDNPNKINYFFFLAPPDLLINSHRPEDDSYQLLDKPMGLKEFEESKMIFIYTFYQYYYFGILELLSHKSPYINITDNRLSIKLKLKNAKFMFHLYLNETEINNSTGYHLDEDGNYIINVIFPESGIYFLKVFYKDRNVDEKKSLDFLLFYLITVNSKKKLERVGIPYCYDNYDCLLMEPKNYYLSINSCVNFKLKSTAYEKVAIIQNGIWTYLKENNNIHEVNIKITHEDVSIYVKKKNSNSNNFTCLYKFLGYIEIKENKEAKENGGKKDIKEAKENGGKKDIKEKVKTNQNYDTKEIKKVNGKKDKLDNKTINNNKIIIENKKDKDIKTFKELKSKRYSM